MRKNLTPDTSHLTRLSLRLCVLCASVAIMLFPGCTPALTLPLAVPGCLLTAMSRDLHTGATTNVITPPKLK